MPAQIILKTRTKQPLLAARINWANPITRGLVHASVPGVFRGKSPNLASTNFSTLYGSASPLATSQGVGANISGVASSRVSYKSPVTSGNMTLFCVAKPTTTGSGTPCFLGVFSVGNGVAVGNYLGIEAGPVYGAVSTDSGNWQIASGRAPVAGETVAIAGSFTASGGRTIYINGVAGNTNATARNPSGLNEINEGCYYGGTVSGYLSPMTGSVVLSLVFNRVLSAAEHKSLTENPWQVFAPETIPLFWAGVTAQSATASIAAAIRADRTASASLNAAIQSAATASATLSGAIQTAQSATSGLTAYIVASSARSSSASLSAAISDARTATSSLSAAVAAARTATAALDSAIQIAATASTGASAAIREAFSLSANLSGAVQTSATASASLAAVVATTNAISSGLSAAIRAEQTAFAGLSAVISASVWPDPEDVKQGVVYGPQGFDYTGEFAGGGGPITRVMQGAEPETIIKTVIKTVYVDRPAASPTPGDGLVMIDGIQITPEAAVIVAARQTTIKAQEVEIASLRSENEALAALLMATMQ